MGNHILSITGISSAAIGIIVAAAAIFGLYKLSSKHRFFKFCSISLLVISLLEVFVFNCNAFALLGRDYPVTTVPLDNAVYLSGLEKSESGTYTGTASEVAFGFENVNIPIGTVCVNAEFEGYKYHFQEFEIGFTDSAFSGLREGMVTTETVKDHPEVSTSVCRFTGNAGNLLFTAKLNAGETIKISSVTFNQPIAFSFNYLRVIGILLFVSAIWALFNTVTFNGKYSKDDRRQKIVIAAVTAAFMLFGLTLTAAYANQNGQNLFTSFVQTSGDQLTQELVDAFKNGSVSLLEEPSAELLALENPYDANLRVESGVSYLWDHVLYNGKYYSYYGIAPVLLLFLPYHLLTGLYFSSTWAGLIFSLAGMFFLSKTYMAIMERWFKGLKFSVVISGLIMLLASSGIFCCLSLPMFYEVAQSSGFFFTAAGAYFLISSNIISDGKISLARIALATSALGLSVMSRPTEAIYALVSLIFLWFGFKKFKQENAPIWKYLLAALLPYIITGSVQMAYNAMRFGSPFEFGIQYSLTITDFTKSQYYNRLAAIGFFNYLFAFPIIKPEFPFFISQFDLMGANGYYFVIGEISIGLFFRALPMFSYFSSYKAHKLVKDTSKSIMLAAACLIAPLIVIFSVWESGYSFRYSSDFAWQMLMGALIILFVLIKYCDNEYKRESYCKFTIWSMVLSFIVNLALISMYVYPNCIGVDSCADFRAIMNVFEFWT